MLMRRRLSSLSLSPCSHRPSLSLTHSPSLSSSLSLSPSSHRSLFSPHFLSLSASSHLSLCPHPTNPSLSFALSSLAEYERVGQEEWLAQEAVHESPAAEEWKTTPESPSAVSSFTNPVVPSSASFSFGFTPSAAAKPTFKAAAGSTSFSGFASAPSSSSGAGEGMLKYLTEPGWRNLLAPEFEKPYFKEIVRFVEQERNSGVEIFPPEEDVFNAFNFTPLSQVKVVILGQDPYFNTGQAHGLCFSVRKGVPVPPSLVTIYKELERTIPGFKRPTHGYLEEWARQGVLLLNATLTVRNKEPNSHAKCGWQTFTDAVISLLNREKEGLVYLLWGTFAQKKGRIVDRSKHHILEAAHPSPMAVKGFAGCDHFNAANQVLISQGKQPIDWRLSP